MSTAIDQAMTVLATLSLEEKLIFLSSFTASFAKEAKKGLKASARKGSSGETTKRKTAPATYAWLAYPKELEKSHPDLFTGITSMPERLKIVKQYKAEHADEYESYKEKYIADVESGSVTPPVQKQKQQKKEKAPAFVSSVQSSPALSSLSSPPVAEPSMITLADTSAKDKVATMKKKLAEKKAAIAKEESDNTPSSSNAAPEKPNTKAKKITVAKKAKAVTATAAAQPGEGEEFITVDGQNYIMLTENNGCFVRNDNGTFGAWVGIYDAETATIRKTDSPSDV